jgi:hypothetical protein
LTIDQFQHAISLAWCDRVAECCQLDASSFDRDKCLTTNDTSGGPERVSTYLYQYKVADAGFASSLEFAPVTASQCISLERNRSCASVDGTEKRNIYTTCMTALQGSVPQGLACTTSAECKGSLYCSAATDGGARVCTPLVANGEACDDPFGNSDRCSYLGIHSSTSLHCAVSDAGRVCTAPLPNGSPCNSDRVCVSGVCSTASRTCVDTQPYPGQATCTFYTKTPPPDAQGQ